jgi:nitroreductase
MQAPSSFNLQHWRLVNVIDLELRKKIRAAAWDQAQVTDASLLFVVAADIKVWQKNPGYYFQNAPKETQDILIPMIAPFYGAVEKTRTSTGCPTATSTLRVYQFRHDRSPIWP